MFYKEQVAGIRTANDLRALSWQDFEYFCKFLLEERGDGIMKVTPKKGAKGGDGGIDLKITKANGEIAYAQCKHWSSRGNGLSKAIRELAGCMTRDDVKSGIFIVSTEASQFEEEEAQKMNIELIDRSAIFYFLGKTRNAKQGTASRHWMTDVLMVTKALCKFVFLVACFLFKEILLPMIGFVAALFDETLEEVFHENKTKKSYRRSYGGRKNRSYQTRRRYKAYS